ncbi:fucose-1-phosphate guanylyltransferase isoform X2 [Parasteatoda tepidariorum]|nr:fucose-1-phosphate guanylyltransferase isoform X2 [Parasteatoda tepidariorum]
MVPFHVFFDPPGYKIGCGGSTMYILSKISKIYGKEMSSMRFLVIPAGGYSQRLPNLTVLGKLFSPLPFGNQRYQMLDLILATYLPFLKRMPPGVFLASSDAIISYNIHDDDEWTFENGGFTALAHPSPILIGTSHGVYAIPENQDFSKGSTIMSNCLRVLQKPTIEEMREKGAVVKNISIPGLDNEEIIFSDSAFFFDHSVSKILLDIYKKHKPIKCELSSYGDFLQPLGLAASPSYIMDKGPSGELTSLQTVLYMNLFGTNLSIFVLKHSNFHHLGTMKEYLQTLCDETRFSEAFSLSKFSLCAPSIENIKPIYIHGTIINSMIHPLSVIPKSTLLEYCDIQISIEAGQNSIISNIHLPGYSIQKLPLPIPDNTLIHTIPLKKGFVTVAFHIHEDIKKTYQKTNCCKMRYFGKELRRFVKYDNALFSSDCDSVSLWETKLFPVCETPGSSFKYTLELVLSIILTDQMCSDFSMTRQGVEWVSMKDILACKDTEKMIVYQENLCEKTSSILK